MEIMIVNGIGTGPTTLAAFDAALDDAGIANCNLIKLSSVIPPNSKVCVIDTMPKTMPGDWGDKLYVVMAEHRVQVPQAEAWAGVGWVIEKTTGKGLFVEHKGDSEHSVREDITQSLRTLMTTRSVDFGDINMHVTGTVCEGQPVCALVAAAYQVVSWDGKSFNF